MWGCEDVDQQMWGCEDVDQQMWGCEDVDQQMWRCADVDQQMWGCEDVDQQMWGCEYVDQQMCGCEDVYQQMWGCEDVLQRLPFYEEPFAGALGKKIPKSWSLYGIWRKYEIPFRAQPVTQGICLAMAGKCLEHQELTMAALLLLGFHCFLRTGEILQIRPATLCLTSSTGYFQSQAVKVGFAAIAGRVWRFMTRPPSKLLWLWQLWNNKWVPWMFLAGKEVGLLSVLCSIKFWRSWISAIWLGDHIAWEEGVPPTRCKPMDWWSTLSFEGAGTTPMLLACTFVTGWLCCRAFVLLGRQSSAQFSSIFVNEHRCYAAGVRGKRRRTNRWRKFQILPLDLFVLKVLPWTSGWCFALPWA